MTKRVAGNIVAVTAAGVILVVIVVQLDVHAVAAAVAAAGWGIVVVSAYRVVPIAMDAEGWRRLLPDGVRPPLPPTVRARWIGEAVNALLPVAQVGGDVVRARLLLPLKVPGAQAAASVAADFTLGLAVQLAFTAIGVAVLLGAAGSAAWMGLAGAALGVGGLMAAQRWGLFGRLGRVADRVVGGERFGFGGAEVDRALAATYSRRGAAAACCLWRLAAWGVRSGEVWLVLHFMGAPVGWAEAVVLESLGGAVRSAAFAIPGALGAQEGAFVVIGLAVGLGGETAFALALVKRLREMVVGVPALVVLSALERRSLMRHGEGGQEIR